MLFHLGAAALIHLHLVGARRLDQLPEEASLLEEGLKEEALGEDTLRNELKQAELQLGVVAAACVLQAVLDDLVP